MLENENKEWLSNKSTQLKKSQKWKDYLTNRTLFTSGGSLVYSAAEEQEERLKIKKKEEKEKEKKIITTGAFFANAILLVG